MLKSQIKKLDKLWSEAVKMKANNRCEYCHKNNIFLNSCYIIGRRYRTLRWDLKNGMCLCYIHHQAYDHHLPQHDDIINTVVGKSRIENLKKQKEIVAKHQNFEEIKSTLLRNTEKTNELQRKTSS